MPSHIALAEAVAERSSGAVKRSSQLSAPACHELAAKRGARRPTVARADNEESNDRLHLVFSLLDAAAIAQRSSIPLVLRYAIALDYVYLPSHSISNVASALIACISRQI